VAVDQPTRIGILVLTHGQAGEELIKSAEMIIGPIDDIAAVPLIPGQSPEEYWVEVERVLRKMPAHNLILTDLFGGTPSNLAAALSAHWQLWVVSGLNLGMLIRAVESRGTLQGEDLAEDVARAGRETVRNVTAMLREMTTRWTGE